MLDGNMIFKYFGDGGQIVVFEVIIFYLETLMGVVFSVIGGGCVGFCGGKSVVGCYCDNLCFGEGDCCFDVCNVCGFCN